MGASPIIAPPQPALSPAAPAAQPSTARPQSRKSPKILQILLQTIRPFPRRKKDPPPNHQPLARNPENLPKSCKSCFRQSALSPAAKKTRRPTINRSPAIPKIPQNPANPASDNPPFPRRKRDPLNNQPLARNPENPPKSCKSCFRQPALSPAAKKTRRPTINRSPAIPKIPQNPANPASDNIHPKIWDAPLLSFQLDSLSLI